MIEGIDLIDLIEGIFILVCLFFSIQSISCFCFWFK